MCFPSGSSKKPAKSLPAPAKPLTIDCPDVDSLRAALEVAAKTPNTTIRMTGETYRLTAPLYVRGDGTTLAGLNLKRAKLVVTYHYTGGEPGVAIVVIPVLGDKVPWTGQKPGLWMNEQGHCNVLVGMLGQFNEFAPTQYAADRSLADYSLFAPILVPASNITLRDFDVEYEDMQAIDAVQAHYTSHLTVTGLRVLNAPTDDGGIWIVGSEYASVTNCQLPNLSFNSCNYAKASDNDITFSLNMEEMCRYCTLQNNSTRFIREGDVLCAFNNILLNKVHDVLPDHASIQVMGSSTRVTVNTCDNYITINGNAKDAYIALNHALGFRDFGITKGLYVETDNVWTESQ